LTNSYLLDIIKPLWAYLFVLPSESSVCCELRQYGTRLYSGGRDSWFKP